MSCVWWAPESGGSEEKGWKHNKNPQDRQLFPKKTNKLEGLEIVYASVNADLMVVKRKLAEKFEFCCLIEPAINR